MQKYPVENRGNLLKTKILQDISSIAFSG